MDISDKDDNNLTFVKQKWYGMGYDADVIYEWCKRNCKKPFGHYRNVSENTQPGFGGKILARIWFFHDPRDAMLFKLKWG